MSKKAISPIDIQSDIETDYDNDAISIHNQTSTHSQISSLSQILSQKQDNLNLKNIDSVSLNTQKNLETLYDYNSEIIHNSTSTDSTPKNFNTSINNSLFQKEKQQENHNEWCY
ncbi:4082_t:CDS:1, partial [Ambispora gerdemannii]